jgi:NAD(P)-dependent dehydrogenase (short-subunit alcohol dehydrogenase family)
MKVHGKTIIVTGAGNGIGREVSLELLRRGAKVVGVDLKLDWLGETKNLAGEASNNFFGFEVNITDRARVHSLAAEISKSAGKVDALVNVAGIIQPFVKINDLDMDDVDRVMNVNFFGPLNMVKTFLPELISRPEAHIVNVSSMGSFAPVPGQTLYGASKAALNMLTEGLRSELKETNVALTLVWPGAIGTNITANSGVTFGSGELTAEQKKAASRVTSSAIAGKMLVDAMEKKANRIYIGSDSKLMGYLTRLAPDFAANLIYKNMKSLLG